MAQNKISKGVWGQAPFFAFFCALVGVAFLGASGPEAFARVIVNGSSGEENSAELAQKSVEIENQQVALFQFDDHLFVVGTAGLDAKEWAKLGSVETLDVAGGQGLAVSLKTPVTVQQRQTSGAEFRLVLATRGASPQEKNSPEHKPSPEVGSTKSPSLIILRDRLLVPVGESTALPPLLFQWKENKFFAFPMPLNVATVSAEKVGAYWIQKTLSGVVVRQQAGQTMQAKNTSLVASVPTTQSSAVQAAQKNGAVTEKTYLEKLLSHTKGRAVAAERPLVRTEKYNQTLEKLLQAIADVESVALPGEKEYVAENLEPAQLEGSVVAGEEFSDDDLAELVRRRQKRQASLSHIPSILPQNLGEAGSYLQQQAEAFDALATARSLEERDKARFRLAQISLFYQRPQEALSWLESMEPDQEDVSASQNYPAYLPAKFLYGIALVNVGREGEATHLFQQDMKEYAEQQPLWLAASYAGAGEHKKAADLFEKNIKFAELYPTRIEVALRTAQARALFALDKFTESKLVLNQLNTENLITDEGKMLMARIALLRKNDSEAEKLFAEVSSSDDLPWAFQAQYDFVKLLHGRGELGVDQAIDYFEQLASLWRSSQLEADILLDLGEMYRQTKDYKKSLARYKTFSIYYASLPEAKKIPEYMSDTFSEVFKPENEERYDDLALLSLYYDFRELTPEGKNGDRLIAFVGEKLQKMGLIDRTIDLYVTQLKYRVKDPEKRAEIGAVLSRLYRLDLQEDKAIQVLTETDFSGMSAPLRQKRLLRLAEAYAQQNNFEKALETLSQLPESDTIIKLKLDVAWQQKDYTKIEQILAPSFQAQTSEWSEQTQENFMRLAYAYYYMKNPIKLKALNTMFATNLAESPLKITLNFMLQDLGENVPTLANVTSDDAMAKVVNYMAEYLQFQEDYTESREIRFQERYQRSLFNRRLRQPSAPRVE